MPKLLLTDRKIKNLPVTGKQVDFFDRKAPRLALRVNPGGTKTWFYFYGSGKNQHRYKIASYPAVSLAEARRTATQLAGQVASGLDPCEERKQERETSFDFDKFVEHFIDTYARPRNRSWEENARILRRDFSKTWGRRDIRKIKKSDVTTVLDKLFKTGGPSAANHAFAHIRKLFNWAVERGYLELSPCEGLKRPHRSMSRDVTLDDIQLEKIWAAADTLGYPFGHFVQLLILTGQRRSEVAQMRWDELDFSENIWRLPRQRTKNDRDHVVPLSSRAIAILKEIPKVNDTLVFPARNSSGNAITGFSKWKKKLDQLSGIEGWRLHDIRRTVATGLAKKGFAPHVVERIQNHVSGTLGGVAGIYNRHRYLDEMRDALNAWSAHLDKISSESRESQPEVV